MFSLCIPTMNRFDNYLKNNLEKYLQNSLIDEIVISDENGNDIKKIKDYFGENRKFKFNINKSRQGPFMNKMICCKLAKNSWIALIDSDNFADNDYFIKMKNFIECNKLNEYTILSPDYASKIFQWEYLSKTKNNLINKNTFKKLNELDKQYISSHKNVGCLSHLFNVGNFVLNKTIVNNITLKGKGEIITKSNSFDVVLFLLLCFEQLNIDFYLIEDCKYIHESSKDSVYLEYANIYRDFANLTYERIYQILLNNI